MRSTLGIAILVVTTAHAWGQLTLPFAGTDSGTTLSSFQITKSGSSGRANTLYISNASNTSDVLLVNTVGLGRAAYFTITNAANNQIALRADSNGTGTSMFGFMTGSGRAGFFRVSNPSNASPALMAQTDGSGAAVRALAGTGLAGDFEGRLRVTGSNVDALTIVGGASITSQVVAASFSGVGTQLTGLSAANINFGTLEDLRLSSNIPRLNSENTWGGRQRFPGGTSGLPGVQVGQASMGLFGDSLDLKFVVNGGPRMTVANNGRVGIGTETPSARLHIRSGTMTGAVTPGNIGLVLEDDTATGIQFFGSSARLLFGNQSDANRMTVGFGASSNRMEFQMGSQTVALSLDGATNFVAIRKLTTPTTALDVNGTITGSAKNFLIDHPQDPYNKTLRHACVESDEYKNVYDGTIGTDNRGYATVALPSWFESLNRDFRYQLTVISDGDEFVQAMIVREIADGKFTLRTSRPNIKVSWMVTGVRKDTYAREHPLEVEKSKPSNERGMLLYEPSSTGSGSQRPR